jgi:replicative DNA helicase
MINEYEQDPKSKYAPHAECALLGSVMMNPANFDLLSGALTENDFSLRNRPIYKSISELVEIGGDIDAVTVAERLGGDNLEYLTELVVNCPGNNVEAYQELVLRCSCNRDIEKLGGKMIDLSFSEGSTDDKLQTVTQMVSSLERGSDDDAEHVDEVVKTVLDTITRRSKGGEKPGLSTGFNSLDSKLVGMNPGEYIVLAARPSMGKTTLAMNIAASVIKNSGNVLVFSAETTKENIIERMISQLSGIPLGRIKTGKFEDSDWHKLEFGVRQLKGKDFNINDVASIPVSRVAAIARKYNRQKSVDLIIVDYLQLLEAKGENETIRVGNVSKSLRAIAKQTNSVVLAIAQLNREGESIKKRPSMKDIRQSGQIEQDANVIMLIHRDDYQNEGSDNKNIAEIIIAKNKDGEAGTVYLGTKFECNAFVNMENYTRPEEPPKKSENSYAGRYDKF